AALRARLARAVGPPLALPQLTRLAHRQSDEHGPEVLAILKLRKPPLGHPTAKAVKRLCNGILFVRDTQAGAAEPLPGEYDQLTIVALPDLAQRVRIAGLKLLEPLSDGRTRVGPGARPGRCMLGDSA